jgi:hypothetical protein
MKRQLKVSVDTLLHHTQAPEPISEFSKNARKQLYMQAVSKKYRQSEAPAGQSFWRVGSGALIFAGVGLFVLIGASSLLAMAGRARPGDTLYSLNRAWERTQVALTQNESEKMKLKLAFVEERLSEVAAISLEPNPLSKAVIYDTAEALDEVDDKLDQSKLALEFGQPAGLTKSEVDNFSRQFAQIAGSYQQELAEVFALSDNEDTKLAKAVSAINEVVAGLLAEPATSNEGYYLQLDGKLSEDSKSFSSLGYDIKLSGDMVAAVFAGLEVQVQGWVNDVILNPEFITHNSEQLSMIDNQTIYSATSQLQSDDSGLFVNGPGGRRIALMGEVSQDDRLKDMVGQEVGFDGSWQAEGVELTKVVIKTIDGELTLPELIEPEARLDESPSDSEADSQVELEIEINSN